MSRWIVRAVALFGASLLLLSACSSGRGPTADGTDTTAKTGTTSGVPQFGDLASPCGPGSSSGTPDTAVDASTVTIGYGDDAGYAGQPRHRPRGVAMP